LDQDSRVLHLLLQPPVRKIYQYSHCTYSMSKVWTKHSTVSKGSIGEEWFDEQQFSGLTLHGMIFELLDNSLQHRIKIPKHHPLHITVQVIQSKLNKKEASKIRIIDNGSGIPEKIIPKAFSPYGMAQVYSSDPEALSEHGMGMKKALRGLGSVHKIVTKEQGKAAFLIETDDIKKMPTPKRVYLQTSPKFDFLTHKYDHGTFIEIEDLSSEARDLLYKSGQEQRFEKNLRWAIGQRYRTFLSQDYLISGGSFELQRLDHNEKVIETCVIEPIAPTLYWNPVGKNERYWFSNHVIKSDIIGEWEAKISFGYAPRKTKKEWDYVKDSPPIRGHPYYSSRRGAGFDIMRKGIVLQTGFFEQEGDSPYVIKEWSNVYTAARGIINLVHGFSSKEEKTGVKNNEAWKECITKIRDIMEGKIAGPKNKEKVATVNWLGKDYAGYKPKGDDEDANEDTYRIGFINQYNTSKTGLAITGFGDQTRDIVFPPRSDKKATEHPPNWKVGIPDVYISRESSKGSDDLICEVKAPGVSIIGVHVYQLFCYMQEKGVAWGLLIGDDLTAGAKEAIRHIQNQNVTGPEGVTLRRGKRKKLGNKGRYVIGFYPCSDGTGLHGTQDKILD